MITGIETSSFIEFVGLFIFLAGFVIGMGAVTVIDVHGLLGNNSKYWTETTIRVHKVTKPLIWVGIFLVILGGLIFYWGIPFVGMPLLHTIIVIILIANGVFLSFHISPILLKREKEGIARELLPVSLKRKIVASLVFSDLGWWIALLLLAWKLTIV